MIAWVASFPRSGNTFFRIALNRLYGIRTSTIYDVDGVARRVGEELVGFEGIPMGYEEMRASRSVHFIKTHKPRFDDRIASEDKAIYLVRDGRDALVSWARQKSEANVGTFEAMLRELIETNPERGSGQWGGNVLSWLAAAGVHVVRYDDLVHDPRACIEDAVRAVDAETSARPDAELPTFADLQRVDPLFFQRGFTGTHADEMPHALHDLFWAQGGNRRAMLALGFGAPGTDRVHRR